MIRDTMIDAVRRKFSALEPLMTERLRRQWAACEAEALGRGGVSWVAEATGISRTTITAGHGELLRFREHPAERLSPERIREPGAGRQKVTQKDAALVKDLERLIDSTTRGDSQSPLLWTCKSTRRLAGELRRQGHQLSHVTVAALLEKLGYSLQANRKVKEGSQHPDRDAQFEHIARQVRDFQKRGQPVVSVDAKNKEVVGDFKQKGREWHLHGRAEEVRAKDFPDKEMGKVTPEGVYDLTRNEGWVSVGIDHDTAEFAGESLRRWWQCMGSRIYRHAKELLVTADAGGSNSYRSRLWKVVLQRLADELGLAITVCHFPPGTSKWNKIEHRLFCHITENWRGRPLRSRAIIVNLIAHTTTEAGLSVQAELDTHRYPQGIKVTNEELAAIQIKPSRFHGDWNYTIYPRAH
jgi:Rhodopirellula transposase DDE domain